MSPREPSQKGLANPAARLREMGLSPRKRYGQHFLLSDDVFGRMVAAAGLGRQDCALEVGAGPGFTTRLLAQAAGHVIAVEIDAELAVLARRTLEGAGNVTLVEGDVLASKSVLAPAVEAALARASAAGLSLKLVANLPYNVSAPLIVLCLENPLGFEGLWVMVQHEVARRLAAAPGTSDYGPLSVFARLWADVRILERVPPSAFWPRPEVESATVELLRRPERARAVEDYATFSEVVRAVLGHRRKTARRALSAHLARDLADAALEGAGVDPSRRADRVTLDEFIRLAGALGRARGGG
jgi:16S rRNA (adenine1518-N6/adenine1519-N6)-dimethyltransferase